MRVVLACLTALALFGVPGHCQDVSSPDAASTEREETVIDFNEDDDIDVRRLLGDLLAGEQKEEQEESDAVGRSGTGKNEQNKQQNRNEPENTMVTDKDAVAKRNQFVDNFLDRLSETMRQSHDPMKLVFMKSGKVLLRQEGKVNNKKKRKLRRRLRKKGNKRKNVKRGRTPKALALEEEGTEEDIPKDNDVSPGMNNSGIIYEDETGLQPEEGTEDDYFEDEALFEYDDVEGEITSVVDGSEQLSHKGENDDYDDEESEVGSVREGKEIGEISEEGRNASGDSPVEGKARRRRKRRRRKGGRRRRCNKACKRKRRNRRRRKNQKRRKAAKAQRGKQLGGPKPTALVTGMSTLRRSGDVRIEKRGENENIEADVVMGPIVLRAQRAFQVGSQKDVRKAEARTAIVKGELVLSLSPNGIELKDLDLVRPDTIEVSGNLARRPGVSSGRFMKTYMSKTQPLIVYKIRKTAEKLLKKSNKNGARINRSTA